MANRAAEFVRNSSRFKFALFIGLLGGAVNVLVDIDHSPVLWGGTATRAFHTPVLISAGIVAFYCVACVARLFFRMVLRHER